MLPPPLSTSESGSLARFTFEVRIPRIIDDVIATNRYPSDIADALRALRAEVLGGLIEPLREDAPDQADWAEWAAPLAGRRWLDAPWCLAEAFFFRRLLEATRFFQPSPHQGRDPYASQKQAELDSPRMRAAIAAGAADLASGAIASRLRACLWGNRADLSHPIVAEAWRAGELPDADGLLVDDAAAAEALLSSGPAALIADNAGLELAEDLLLAAALFDRHPNARLTIHLKPYPVYVSDAVAADVEAALGVIAVVAPDVAAGLSDARASGRLRFSAETFWTSGLFFRDMPAPLRQTLGAMRAVVVKGDANYRRLIGDARWPPETPLARAAAGFPAPVIAIRTLKSDPIAGLPQGASARLDREDRHWRQNGRFGVLQVAHPEP